MSSESTPSSWKNNRLAAALVVLLLSVHGVLGLHAAFQHSVTNDEFWHIPTGVWNLTQGRFHYENLNPPLVRGMSALPLIVAGAETGDVAEGADKETRADAFVAANRDRYSQLVSLARIVPVLLSVATGWILALWARDSFGVGSGVLATAMWALSPNVIAHGSLATTDVAAAGAMLVVIRMAWQFAGEPGWKRAVCLGLCLGLAQLVKFTCVIAFPLAIFVWVIRRAGNRKVASVRFVNAVAMWGVASVLLLCVVNAGYLFRGTGQTLSTYSFSSQAMQGIAGWVSGIADLPVPFPKDYVEGIDHQRHIMEGAHPSFLDGEIRIDGFPNYYLKAWWYKAPHATQALCLLGAIVVLWPWRKDRQTRLQLVLLMPIVVLLVLASGSSMQLGLRYLLPVFPFAFMFASQLASVGKRQVGLPQVMSLVAALALVPALRFHPHHLEYFNEQAGGPQNGHLHLLDSNVDWGQGLLGLRAYVEKRQLEKIGLVYFGAVNPADFDIPFFTAPQFLPNERRLPQLEPGVYAVSANFLMGRPGMIREPDGTTWGAGPHQFGYFRKFKPVEKIGNCLFIYDLSAEEIARTLP